MSKSEKYPIIHKRWVAWIEESFYSENDETHAAAVEISIKETATLWKVIPQKDSKSTSGAIHEFGYMKQVTKYYNPVVPGHETRELALNNLLKEYAAKVTMYERSLVNSKIDLETAEIKVKEALDG